MKKMYCDLINKVNNNELWLDTFVYPTTGKYVIRFVTFDTANGGYNVEEESSSSTFRRKLNDFYKMNPRKVKKTAKEYLTLHSVDIPIKKFYEKNIKINL